MFQKKRDKRSIQSSEWIYDALNILLKEKSYNEITVTDIVNKANLGRTTFYRNFKTIDDVLRMKCDEKFLEFRNYCINYYQNYFNEDKTFLKPFLRFWYENSEIIELLMKAERENIIKEYLSSEIYFFIKTSDIYNNEIISKHLNYFVEIRVSNSISILTEWIKNNKNLSPDELSEIINSQVQESLKYNLLF